MRIQRSTIIKATLVFLVSLVVLTPGFNQNTWGAAGRKWFGDWRTFQEFMLIGRLAETRQNGLFSHSGLIGLGDGDSWMDVGNGLVEHQSDVYLNNGSFQKFAAYDTEPAGYSLFFGLIDQLTNFSPGFNLKLFRLISALLSAAALAVLVTWLALEFGLLTAGLTLVFCAFSEWLTLFGGSMYWNLWSYYLPFLSLLLILAHARGREFPTRAALWLVFATVLLSGLIRGFLYISTMLIMLCTPLVYFAACDGWGWKSFIKRLAQVSASALAGTLAAFLVFTAQISMEKGGLAASLAHIQDTLLKRSFASPESFSGLMADSLRASLPEVLLTYVRGRALNFNGLFHTNLPWLEISFQALFILFALGTLALLARDYFGVKEVEKDMKGRALALAAWFSALAPLSWLVLFKAHSYIHTQMNFILWQMPFTLLGMALCGYTLARLVKRG